MAFIPNGSGDDTCFGIGIDTPMEALRYICKGETIKIDANRTLLDHETEEDITGNSYDHMRYSLANVSFGFTAKVALEAIAYKGCCGKAAYQLAAMKLLIKKKRDTWDIIIDDKLTYENQ